jgi:hypothetical protein
MARAQLWCDSMAPILDLHLVAAVGVFSTPTRLEMRRAIRGSWLPHVPSDTAVRFVLRGHELEADVMRNIVAEAHAWGGNDLGNASS